MRCDEAFEQIATPAAASAGSASFATSVGSAENASWASKPGAVGSTSRSRTYAGTLPGSTQRTPSPYLPPMVRSEPVSAVTSNHGWPSSNCTNRCPTAPVAPRIATLTLFDIGSPFIPAYTINL